MAPNRESLKDQNRLVLATIIVGNVIAFYLTMVGRPLLAADFSSLLKNWMTLIPAGGVFVLTAVLTELFSGDTKARLVFWHWHDPLPGARAFSEYLQRDARIDVKALKSKLGPLPTTAAEQNALWYKLYISVQDDPRIVEIQRSYLFTRDYAAMSVLFALLFGILAFVLIRPLTFALAYFGALLLQYLMVRQAAKNHGERFVTTVLALIAAT